MAEPDPPIRATYFARHFRTAMSDTERREAAQRHLDARSERIAAYVVSLEAALAGAAAGGNSAAQLEGRLLQARRDLQVAARARLPETKPPAAKPRAARVQARAATAEENKS